MPAIIIILSRLNLNKIVYNCITYIQSKTSSLSRTYSIKKVLLKKTHKLSCTHKIKKPSFKIVHNVYQTDHLKEDNKLNYLNCIDVTREE